MLRTGFITANLQRLIIFSWPVDAAILSPQLPDGLEVDEFAGRAYVSVVGLTVTNLRAVGIPTWPTRFAEANFRFYVRRITDGGGHRRGVVFRRQIVPHRLTAWGARLTYGGPFTVLPITEHRDEPAGDSGDARLRVAYRWESGGKSQELWASCNRCFEYAQPDSLAEFLTARHWGYNGAPGRRTKEYAVSRAQWTLATATDYGFDCDARAIVGDHLGLPLENPPASVLLASGGRAGIGWPHPISARRGRTNTG